MGINKFSDRLEHEISDLLNGFNNTLNINNENTIQFITPVGLVLPEIINWIELGAVTDVKDQGFCGSCWAFSTTGTLEGQHFRLTNQLISLSEQNLIDCSWEYGNNGCVGGMITYSYEYIQNNGGIDTEESYPYQELDYSRCYYRSENIGATLKGYVRIKSNDESQLKEAVGSVGPISVAIDASHSSFHHYQEGIYYEEKCNISNSINHAVLVIGYGTDEKTKMDYWLVKNSWGTNWGDQGYIKMARNRNNNCFIASVPTYPLV